MLVDTHVHLNDQRFDADRDAVIARALESGVLHLIEIADKPDEWERAVSLASCYPRNFRCTLGLHPYHADEWSPALVERLKVYAKRPEVVAIGEIGLDYFRHCTVSRERQIEALAGMLQASWDLSLPTVIHCRDAYDDILLILKEFFGGKKRRDEQRFFGVIHCFSGTAEQAQQAVGLGFALGVDGPVTYPKNDALREALGSAGLDSLVLETDSPWLPPQSSRGKRNDPSAIPAICTVVADIFKIKKEEAAAATTRNARDLFLLPLS